MPAGAGLIGYRWRENHRHVQEVLESRGAELAAAYEGGASLKGLAAETGLNHITIRTFLIGRGVTLRHDHGWHRKRNGRRTGRGHGR